MAQDGKSVVERASELRDLANKISSLTDEQLKRIVGGINSEDPEWSAINAWRDYFFTDQP